MGNRELHYTWALLTITKAKVAHSIIALIKYAITADVQYCMRLKRRRRNRNLELRGPISESITALRTANINLFVRYALVSFPFVDELKSADRYLYKNKYHGWKKLYECKSADSGMREYHNYGWRENAVHVSMFICSLPSFSLTFFLSYETYKIILQISYFLGNNLRINYRVHNNIVLFKTISEIDVSLLNKITRRESNAFSTRRKDIEVFVFLEDSTLNSFVNLTEGRPVLIFTHIKYTFM